MGKLLVAHQMLAEQKQSIQESAKATEETTSTLMNVSGVYKSLTDKVGLSKKLMTIINNA